MLVDRLTIVAYARWCRRDEVPTPSRLERWAHDRVGDLSHVDPERCWSILRAVVARLPEPDVDPEPLSSLGADGLEALLGNAPHLGDRAIACLDQDRNFAWAGRSAWLDEPPEERYWSDALQRRGLYTDPR